MKQRSRLVVQFSDPILTLLSLLAAYVLMWQHRPEYNHAPFSTRRSVHDFAAILLLLICWHGLFALVGFYRSRPSSYFNIHPSAIFAAAALCPVPVLLCWAITRDERRSNFGQALEIACLTAAIMSLLLLASRYLFTLFKRHLWYGVLYFRRVLVVGTNQRAIKFVTDAQNNPDCGFHCLGFVDDGWFSALPLEQSPLPLRGGISELTTLLRTMAVDEVVVALPMASFYERTAAIVVLCETLGVRVRIIGQLFETCLPQPWLTVRGVSPTWTVYEPAWDELANFSKRSFDVIVSATLLVLLLPLFALIAAAIASTSDGPILFRQVRLGQGKRHFRICKFRTMVVNANQKMKEIEHLNQTGGPTFKLKNDPRVTKAGAFLRKTSLDELPQLLNVLVGDMSLVGPRPLPLRDYEGFSEDRHRRRFSVKPGITCLWQVMGRNTILFDQWMALDSRYIDERTFWLDLRILLKTLPAVLGGSGAM